MKTFSQVDQLSHDGFRIVSWTERECRPRQLQNVVGRRGPPAQVWPSPKDGAGVHVTAGDIFRDWLFIYLFFNDNHTGGCNSWQAWRCQGLYSEWDLKRRLKLAGVQ